jgi:hypothetical protein
VGALAVVVEEALATVGERKIVVQNDHSVHRWKNR